MNNRTALQTRVVSAMPFIRVGGRHVGWHRNTLHVWLAGRRSTNNLNNNKKTCCVPKVFLCDGALSRAYRLRCMMLRLAEQPAQQPAKTKKNTHTTHKCMLVPNLCMEMWAGCVSASCCGVVLVPFAMIVAFLLRLPTPPLGRLAIDRRTRRDHKTLSAGNAWL